MSRFILRLRILLNDRTAGVCYIISAIVMLCLLAGLQSVSEERSAVPIGLVVEDDSQEARELAESIRKTPSVYVNEGTKDDLKEKLLDGYINCIFIIDEGYGEKIKRAETGELVTILSGEDSRLSIILGDIIAGSMLYDLCLNKGYKLYDSLPGDEKLDWYEYRSYVLTLKDDPTFAFSFDISYENPKEKEIEERDVTNGMIYRQMIAGMLAMLLCLMSFVSCNCFCLEYENGVARRLKNLPVIRICSEVMDFFGIFVYTLPLSVVAGILFENVKSILISLVYLSVMCLVCMIISKLVKKTESYQLVGAVLVIGLGVLGFVSVFAGIIGGPEFLKATPNAIYIEAMLAQ